MTLVIGLTGEKGSGKQTFTDFLIQIATSATPPRNDKENITIKQVRFSDILAETLELWDIPATRANFQKMAIVMNEGFGLGTLTHAVYTRISHSKANIIILDGIRWETDPEMLRKFPNNLLVYITADASIRYERLKKRGDKANEKNASFEQFMAEETAKTEIFIPKIGASADIKIENNRSLEEFRIKIEDLYNQKIKSQT